MYFPGIIIYLLIMYNDIGLFVHITGYIPVHLLKDIFVASTLFLALFLLCHQCNQGASCRYSLNES